MLLTSLDALLTAYTRAFINDSSKGAVLLLHVQCPYRASLQTGRFAALVAYLRPVVPFDVLFFDGNPRERRGIPAFTVKVGTDHFADTTSATESLVYKNGHPG
jgi:hypothetical protein